MLSNKTYSNANGDKLIYSNKLMCSVGFVS